MIGKKASEQINILENITIEILSGVVKDKKEKKKVNLYSLLAKKYRKKFTKALRKMRSLLREPVLN